MLSCLGRRTGVNVTDRFVCKADAAHRSACDSDCGGCGQLIADRRQQKIQTLNWSLSEDRRIISSWFPASRQIAGVDFASPATRSLSSDITWRESLPLIMVVLLVTFNLFDSLLTARALSLGFAEANPVMAGLFNLSMPMGMFLKSVIVGTGALFLWKYRHVPIASRGIVGATSCYGAVILYHLYFQMIVI